MPPHFTFLKIYDIININKKGGLTMEETKEETYKRKGLAL